MEVKDHDKRVNIMVEPKNHGYDLSVIAVCIYTYLKPGSSRVNMSLRTSLVEA